MAVSAAAALLDELMGRNRNDGPNAQKKPVHWEDPEVIIIFITFQRILQQLFPYKP